MARCRDAAAGAILVALLFGACGGGDEAPGGATESEATASTRRTDGEALAMRHRCGACHLDLPSPPTPPSFGDPGPLAVFSTLRAVIGSNAHPNFHLSEGEALALALGVASGGERGAAGRELARLRWRHPEATVELGRQLARGLNCAGCHAGLPGQGGVGPLLLPVVAGSRPEWLRSFLQRPNAIRPFGTMPGSGARMPDFGLSAAEVDSLLVYLERASRGVALAAAPAPAETPTGTGGPESAEATPLSVHAATTADALLDRLSCRGCHSYGGRGGRIGPALDDVRGRRTPAYIASMVRDPQATLPGSAMPRVRDARVDRVITLLVDGDIGQAESVPLAAGEAPVTNDTRQPHARFAPAVPSPPPAPTPSPVVRRFYSDAGRGAMSRYLSALDHPLSVGTDGTGYGFWCGACHGTAGLGDGYNARYLETAPARHADPAAMSLRPDDTLYDGISAGGVALGRSPEMPGFGGSLDDGRVRELVRAIRRMCRCSGPPWSPEAHD